TGSDAGTCRWWNVERGTVLNELSGHRSQVTALAISGDNSVFATGDAQGQAVVWDAKTCRSLWTLHDVLHTGKVTAIAFIPNTNDVLTSSTDKTVARWNVSSGKLIESGVLKHPNGVVAMAVSPDGQFAVTACDDHHIRKWDLDTSRVVSDVDTGAW